MSAPLFRLQIVDRHNHVVVSPFNGGSVLERDLVEACVARIVAQGVGLFKTEAQVTRAIRAGITAAMQDLKDDTRYVARQG